MSIMPTLALGAKGDSVVTLTNALAAAGFPSASGDPSVFGPVLMATVQQFQAAKGLAIDGIVGPNTWAALGYQGSIDPINSTVTGVTGSTGPSGEDPALSVFNSDPIEEIKAGILPALGIGLVIWLMFMGGGEKKQASMSGYSRRRRSKVRSSNRRKAR